MMAYRRFSLPRRLSVLALVAAAFTGLLGCDTDITGTPLDNQPPDTQLSVRDSSLVDNLNEEDRLTSSVLVSWSGTDPDGFVVAFELRYYNENERPAPAAGWTRTTRTDSLVLLPIPRGQRAANVVFEVRALDNEGLLDPDPARTVFPIRNAPPALRLSAFDLPPDTTFTIFSIGFTASDPEGPDNLSGIEVSLNDSTRFVTLPAETEFVSFVGDVDRSNPGQQTTTARVYTGRGFQRTAIEVPGLRLDAENTLFLRAVDQTDTTSALQRFSWYVKQPRSEVLYVNDYRTEAAPVVQAFHLDLLRAYLPAGMAVDVYDVSKPSVTGSSGNVPRSDLLPPNADPTLRQTLALYKYIYWVSTNATNSIQGNNLPFAASVMDVFFDNGGKVLVHTPISLPNDPESNLGNAAILLLPLSDLITIPDTLRPSLRLPSGADVQPVAPVPGVGETLPPLKTTRFIINALPYVAEGQSIIPLYRVPFQYLTRQGARSGTWPGPSTVASLSADRRVGLFALPLVNEQTGAPVLAGPDGDPAAARRAVHLMLESLGFPKR